MLFVDTKKDFTVYTGAEVRGRDQICLQYGKIQRKV